MSQDHTPSRKRKAESEDDAANTPLKSPRKQHTTKKARLEVNQQDENDHKKKLFVSNSNSEEKEDDLFENLFVDMGQLGEVEEAEAVEEVEEIKEKKKSHLKKRTNEIKKKRAVFYPELESQAQLEMERHILCLRQKVLHNKLATSFEILKRFNRNPPVPLIWTDIDKIKSTQFSTARKLVVLEKQINIVTLQLTFYDLERQNSPLTRKQVYLIQDDLKNHAPSYEEVMAVLSMFQRQN